MRNSPHSSKAGATGDYGQPALAVLRQCKHPTAVYDQLSAAARRQWVANHKACWVGETNQRVDKHTASECSVGGTHGTANRHCMEMGSRTGSRKFPPCRAQKHDDGRTTRMHTGIKRGEARTTEEGRMDISTPSVLPEVQ